MYSLLQYVSKTMKLPERIPSIYIKYILNVVSRFKILIPIFPLAFMHRFAFLANAGRRCRYQCLRLYPCLVSATP